MRRNMWEKVEARVHRPTKIFAFKHPARDDDEGEFMVHGTVEYAFKDGWRSPPLDFAARAKVAQKGADRKLTYYQVYMVRFRGCVCEECADGVC